MLAAVLAFGLAFTGCDNNDDTNGDDTSPAEYWSFANFGGSTAVLRITGNSWTMSVAGGPSGSGTFTMSGNVATLHSGGSQIGTATITGSTMTLVLNPPSEVTGTFQGVRTN